MQGPRPRCASHAVGKAIQAHFHGLGYETNQDDITVALRKEVQNDGKAKNPDEFNAKKITVSYSEGFLKNETAIELKVVTHKGDFDNSNMTFKTELIVGMDSWKMVLR